MGCMQEHSAGKGDNNITTGVILVSLGTLPDEAALRNMPRVQVQDREPRGQGESNNTGGDTQEDPGVTACNAGSLADGPSPGQGRATRSSKAGQGTGSGLEQDWGQWLKRSTTKWSGGNLLTWQSSSQRTPWRRYQHHGKILCDM